MEATVFLFANATKIYHFIAKNPEIKPYLLCLGKNSKDFTANIMKKKQDQMDMYLIFQLIVILLIPVIFDEKT